MFPDLEKIYKAQGALLEGHFLLSSGQHSQYYLQSAKVLEDPKLAGQLAGQLAEIIQSSKVPISTICSPALGGIIAGYELARCLGVRFIFTERVNGVMSLRRGFQVSPDENILICEDIITTGGSALESAEVIRSLGGNIVGYSALANRGLCKRIDGQASGDSARCKLEDNLPLFALDDFLFESYDANNCPLCEAGSPPPYKPGSRT